MFLVVVVFALAENDDLGFSLEAVVRALRELFGGFREERARLSDVAELELGLREGGTRAQQHGAQRYA